MSERRCIVTRSVGDPDQMIRFVLSPDAEVVPDLVRKLPGRGVWVGLHHGLVAKAVTGKLFDRGFGTACRVDANLPDLVGDMLRERALSYLSLAKKAGLVTAGFEMVSRAMADPGTRVLIAASDGARDGKKKLAGKTGENDIELIEFFDSAQLGLALGRANVIHAAVGSGGLTEKFVSAVKRAAVYAAG